MEVNLLLVASHEFPTGFRHALVDYGFHCLEARGRLKVKQILEESPIHTILWLYQSGEQGMADDLLPLFNLWGQIPLVLLTNEDDIPFEEEIQGLCKKLDTNDEIQDLIKAVDQARSLGQAAPPNLGAEQINEIDFKHVVNHITSHKEEGSKKGDNQFRILTPWIAVDQQERKILSTKEFKDRSLWGRIWDWFIWGA